MTKINPKFICATSLIALAAVGCGGSKGSTNAGPGTYALTVTSVNPTSGLALAVSPADVNSAGASGAPTPETDLSLIYNTGTAVTLTAPATTSAGSAFVAWVGCDSVSGYVCKVTMSASKSVEVEYSGVSSISINPQTITVPAGGGVQIPATVNGFGMCSLPTLPTQPCAGSPVTYSLYLPSGVTGSLGTVSPTGLYTPASSSPASAVNVTVQSTFAPNVTAVGLITLQQ
ncbi:MAG: hypothetical protein ABR971_03060 [Acidobacteriaceae bacterium]|jgi:hypothetical protein